MDFFLLARYTPKLSEKINLFSQLELVNAFPTLEEKNFSLTQRIRLGLKQKEWQYGMGVDLTSTGKKEWDKTRNIGAFLRYEF